MGSYANVIDAASHAATKASNLGDVEVLCAYALVGGRVWTDTNGDAIQNGADAGIAGVVLELFQGNRPLTAPTLAAATTDVQGRYLFAIPPNSNLNIRLSAASRTSLRSQGYLSYTRENAPGSTDTNDSDASQFWGYLEFARPGQNTTTSAIPPPWRESDARSFDIGVTRIQPTAHVGDQVWNDRNGNGVQDAGEPGVAGVAVTLTGVDTATLGPISASATTDGSGTYRFGYLPPGRYQVRFTVPVGMRATLRDQGGDDTRDSDVDAASGYTTAPFDLGANQWRDEWDFGLIANADVAVSKTGPLTAGAGQSFSYTLTARNLTAIQADGVVVADTLPAGLVYVSASPAPTSRSGQSLTWSLGSLAGNGSQVLTVNVRAPLAFTPVTATTQTIANCASITIPTPESTLTNNSACATTTLQRPDITFIRLRQGWMYLVAVLDWYSRYIVSWAFSDTLEIGFVLDA
ncbi:MAG: DUF11 domain-containing protein, partial [Chloroflexales bacterium]|nr:DUF11 domain-containing protein [Chloroflexales bacterium]